MRTVSVPATDQRREADLGGAMVTGNSPLARAALASMTSSALATGAGQLRSIEPIPYKRITAEII